MEKETKPKAVVLLSGGLDSSTTLAIAQAKGFGAHPVTFLYGQRHDIEVQAARRVAKAFDSVPPMEVAIDLRQMGGSALTSDIPVPKGRSDHEMETGIPSTYVPARNTILLSYALAFAEVLDARDIFIGVNAVDYSGYPDCRPEYIQAFEKMAALATKAGVEGNPIKIHTPLIHLTKAEIILKGMELGVDYGLTHSCYDPTKDGLACGRCDSCLLRKKGFMEARIPDPTKYVKET